MKRIFILSALVLLCVLGQCQVWKIVRTDGSVEKIPALSIEFITIEEIVEHEYVDLGLPSGTLWATMNVGADSPEDFGNFFAWGEVVGVQERKKIFSWADYKWCNGVKNQLTKYCLTDSLGAVSMLYDLQKEDDAAYVNWGSHWRMPNYRELIELAKKCVWTRTELNGVSGCEVKGPNGKTLFLPAGGWYSQGAHKGVGRGGDYWGSSLRPEDNTLAWGMWFFDDGSGSAIFKRYYGRMVRPVYVP